MLPKQTIYKTTFSYPYLLLAAVAGAEGCVMPSVFRVSIVGSGPYSRQYVGIIAVPVLDNSTLLPITPRYTPWWTGWQGSRKSIAALALLADKLKSHGQIVFKITYILSKFCPKCV